MYLLSEATLASSITDVTSVLTAVIGQITGNEILMTLFASGLFVAGAKIFNR